ncbi:MAG: deoxyribonuclease V [Phycisphaerales bacterium]|nr:MAG: deoxyribonuclease V [Phycisphaerales bacterium]
MKLRKTIHRWNVSPQRAVAIQKELAGRIIRRTTRRRFRLVAGADLAFTPDKQYCVAGIVVWDVPGRRAVEQQTARRRVTFPYVPGLLSFREAPAVLAAIRKLVHEPDALILDGQGYAHPRRFGLACHVGLFVERPSIGCAKSRLIGTHGIPGRHKGSITPLRDGDEQIGAVVRTRDDVKPVYVSIGHRIDLDTAVDLVVSCCTGFRLPEPTRLADQLVSRARNLQNA